MMVRGGNIRFRNEAGASAYGSRDILLREIYLNPHLMCSIL